MPQARSRAKELRDSLQSALSDPRLEPYAAWYLSTVHTNWHLAQLRLRRIVLLGVALVAAYFLLGGGSVAEVALGGVRLDKEALSALAKITPAVVAVLIAEGWTVTDRIGDYTLAFRAFMRTKGFREQHLIEIAGPPGLELFGLVGKYDNVWMLSLVSVNVIALFALPFAFLVYAYIDLFLEFGTGDLLVWASLAFAALNAMRAILIVAR